MEKYRKNDVKHSDIKTQTSWVKLRWTLPGGNCAWQPDVDTARCPLQPLTITTVHRTLATVIPFMTSHMATPSYTRSSLTIQKMNIRAYTRCWRWVLWLRDRRDAFVTAKTLQHAYKSCKGIYLMVPTMKSQDSKKKYTKQKSRWWRICLCKHVLKIGVKKSLLH